MLVEIVNPGDQVEQGGGGRGHLVLGGAQHDDGQVTEVLAVGESGDEGSQESNRELRAIGNPEVEEHLVAVLASARLAVHEGRVVAREGGKLLLRLLLVKRLVFTEPNRLGNERYEAVEVDALVGGAGDLGLLNGRRRDVPRDAGLVGLVDDLLDLQAIDAWDSTVCRIKPD